MAELPPFPYEAEPHPTIDVDLPTVFALREYMELRNTSLVQAMNHLIVMGLLVHECDELDERIVDFYPYGQKFYQADEAIYDDVKDISYIQADLKADMQFVLDSIADDLGIDRNAAFAQLVEYARDLYIKQERGAELYRITSDGRKIRLL